MTPSPPPGYVLVEDMLQFLPFERVRELCIGRQFLIVRGRCYYPPAQSFLADLHYDMSFDIQVVGFPLKRWTYQPGLCVQIDLCDLLGN